MLFVALKRKLKRKLKRLGINASGLIEIAMASSVKQLQEPISYYVCQK
jgi:post-segregation antitoxin (ccd killing protein)